MFRDLSPALKFLLAGGVNTIAGLAVIYAAKWLAHCDDVLANGLGYGAGLCISFVLNKNWTFRYAGSSGAAMIRFLLVFALAYAMNLGTVLFAVRHLGLDSYLSQALGIVPYALFGFLASRHYVFGPGTPEQRPFASGLPRHELVNLAGQERTR